MFCFGQWGFFITNQPKQSIMKPRLKFARVRIVWESGRIPCLECPFNNLRGWEPICKAYMKAFLDGSNDGDFHPIIVRMDS